MRILVTGVTGVLGRAVARQLVAAGHAVTGIAAVSHANLHPDVDLAATSLRDPILQRLADAADVVLHLAPIEPGIKGSAGVDGLVRVAHATARAGARLIYVSAAAGAPDLYGPAEVLVTSGWAPSLVVRVAPPLGRQLDWMICRTVASLLDGRAANDPVRVLHFDDLLRFLVLAVATHRTGVVDLAGAEPVDGTAARDLLRQAGHRSLRTLLPGWAHPTAHADLAAVRDDWRFEFAWPTAAAIADTARGLTGRGFGPQGARTLAGRLAVPTETVPPVEPLDGAAMRSALPDEQTGEFDELVDPRFPTFSAVALAETLPGPLTPMTLDVQIAGLRAAARAVGSVMSCGDVIAAEWASRAVAVFGHRPYLGVTADAIAAGQLPGWDGVEAVRTSVGDQPPRELFPLGLRQTGPLWSAAVKAIVLRRALTRLRHLRTDTRAYLAAAAVEEVVAAQLDRLSDAQLQARIRLLRDRIHQGWELTGLWLVDSGVTAAAVRRRGVRVAIPGLSALLDSDAVAAETSALAALIRADPAMCEMALDGELAGTTAASNTVGAALTAAVHRIGHRGPGEVELANLMIEDDPSILVAAAGRAAADVPQRGRPAGGADRLSVRWAASARASRESAYDTTLKFTHQLRITLRAMGFRYVAAELIDVAGEIFYLTCDEAVTLPSDARLRIKRRRAERERLQGFRPPDVVVVS